MCVCVCLLVCFLFFLFCFVRVRVRVYAHVCVYACMFVCVCVHAHAYENAQVGAVQNSVDRQVADLTARIDAFSNEVTKAHRSLLSAYGHICRMQLL